jgi:hypothetical protein
MKITHNKSTNEYELITELGCIFWSKNKSEVKEYKKALENE